MSEAKVQDAEPKKGKKKVLIIAALGLMLAAGGAAGAWFAMGGAHAKPHEAVEEKKAPKKQLFTTLEPFTVNLQDARGERFAQIGITLQFEDPNLEVTLKDHLPAVRNGILLLISSKQMEELLTTEGKRALADEIKVETARAIGIPVAAAPAHGASSPAHGASAPAAHGAPAAKVAAAVENPVREVLFSQFIVQ
jgi:flagellar FliL protein